jgi:hypothetical protein
MDMSPDEARFVATLAAVRDATELLGRQLPEVIADLSDNELRLLRAEIDEVHAFVKEFIPVLAARARPARPQVG